MPHNPGFATSVALTSPPPTKKNIGQQFSTDTKELLVAVHRQEFSSYSYISRKEYRDLIRSVHLTTPPYRHYLSPSAFWLWILELLHLSFSPRLEVFCSLPLPA